MVQIYPDWISPNQISQDQSKLAQIGSRLIDSTAKKMANEFFGKFAEEVGGGDSETEPEDAPAAQETTSGPSSAEPAPAAPTSEAGGGISPAIWVGGLITVVVVVLLALAA